MNLSPRNKLLAFAVFNIVVFSSPLIFSSRGFGLQSFLLNLLWSPTYALTELFRFPRELISAPLITIIVVTIVNTLLIYLLYKILKNRNLIVDYLLGYFSSFNLSKAILFIVISSIILIPLTYYNEEHIWPPREDAIHTGYTIEDITKSYLYYDKNGPQVSTDKEFENRGGPLPYIMYENDSYYNDALSFSEKEKYFNISFLLIDILVYLAASMLAYVLLISIVPFVMKRAQRNEYETVSEEDEHTLNTTSKSKKIFYVLGVILLVALYFLFRFLSSPLSVWPFQ